MIQWNDTLATGHEQVDNDHKQLIQSLNDMEVALQTGAGKEQMIEMISFLNSYARGHFTREEAYMAKVKCPSHGENCRAHAEFVKKLDVWVTKLEAGATTSLALEIYRETAAWIRGHILKIDCQLRSCQS